MNYRQSIISLPKNCITVDASNIYFTITKGQKVVVSFADGVSNYLFEQFYINKSFTLSSGNSLYFEINLDTGSCDLVYRNSSFSYGNHFPSEPQENECFYELSTNKMYYWNGYNWAQCLRIFICYVMNGIVNIFPINKSHVGLNQKCTSVKLQSNNWKKIKNNNMFELATTLDSSTPTEYLTLNRLNTIIPICGENIPKYSCIGIANDGKYYKCTNYNLLTCVGITTENSYVNMPPKMIYNGIIESLSSTILTSFNIHRTPLYMGSDGNISTTSTDSNIKQTIGYVINQFSIFINIGNPISEIKYV